MNTKFITEKIQKQKQITEILPVNRFSNLSVANLTKPEQQSVIEMALSILAGHHQKGDSLTSPGDTRKYFQLLFAQKKNEVFGLLFLDNQHRIICFDELFQGTLDSAMVYPRVVIQRALEVNAGAVIATHNHPSGLLEPSSSDKHITEKLKQALTVFDIKFLDHCIVSSKGFYSFAENGLI